MTDAAAVDPKWCAVARAFEGFSRLPDEASSSDH
jgi:hypothetical protein